MPTLKNHGLPEGWKLLRLRETDTPESVALPMGPLMVPLSVWLLRRRELVHREYEHGWPLGLWLSDEDDLAAAAEWLDDFSLIALDHSGEHASAAKAIRDEYGFGGEVKSIKAPISLRFPAQARQARAEVRLAV